MSLRAANKVTLPTQIGLQALPTVIGIIGVELPQLPDNNVANLGDTLLSLPIRNNCFHQEKPLSTSKIPTHKPLLLHVPHQSKLLTVTPLLCGFVLNGVLPI